MRSVFDRNVVMRRMTVLTSLSDRLVLSSAAFIFCHDDGGTDSRGTLYSRVQTERDGSRAETGFGLPAKRTSPFISAGVLVRSSTGFLGVRVGRERL